MTRYTVEFHGTAGSWYVHDAQKEHEVFGQKLANDVIHADEICEQLNAKDAEIAAQAADIRRLRGALQSLAHIDTHTRANSYGVATLILDNCRAALLAPAPDPAPAATSIPALTPYAAEQVAKVTAEKADERQVKR